MIIVKWFILILLGSLVSSNLHAQSKSSIQQLQGFWRNLNEENEAAGYKGYAYYEGHYLYNISYHEGKLSVQKYYVAFYDQIPEDSIALNDFKESGEWYGFIDYMDLIGNPKKIRAGDFNNYGYDLEEGSFNYYGGSPNVFSKIKSLPTAIYPQFLKKKDELDRAIIFDFVPDYKRKGANPLPYRIEAINDKVYFHTLPDATTQRKAFIIKGQEAKVLDYKKGWYFILFEGKSRTTGWVKEAEFNKIDLK